MGSLGATVLEPFRRSEGAKGDRSDVEKLLLSTGVVIDHPDVGLELESSFRTAWHDRIAELREGEGRLEELGAVLGVNAGSLRFEITAEGYAATDGRSRVGLWPSEAAFLADLAAVPLLEEAGPAWRGFDDDERGAVLSALRMFLAECPKCEGAVVGSVPAGPFRDSTRGDVSVECEFCGVKLV